MIDVAEREQRFVEVDVVGAIQIAGVGGVVDITVLAMVSAEAHKNGSFAARSHLVVQGTFAAEVDSGGTTEGPKTGHIGKRAIHGFPGCTQAEPLVRRAIVLFRRVVCGEGPKLRW